MAIRRGLRGWTVLIPPSPDIGRRWSLAGTMLADRDQSHQRATSRTAEILNSIFVANDFGKVITQFSPLFGVWGPRSQRPGFDEC